MKQTGIIIQARMGSSRLPGKMGRTFYNGKSLLEVILERLKSYKNLIPLVVATSNSEEDNYIAETSASMGFRVFRGSNNDVMSRFIGAAKENGISRIIRICADNPFIQNQYIDQLISFNSNSTVGYVGFRINKSRAAIATHLGFFPEMVSIEALEEVYNEKLNKLYKEHVTNYFYGSENTSFPVSWIDVELPESYLNDLRLTIDTIEDFNVMNEIYKNMKEGGRSGTITELVNFLKNREDLIRIMKKGMSENEK